MSLARAMPGRYLGDMKIEPRSTSTRSGPRRAQRRGVSRLLARVVARLGRTTFGVLRRSRRIVAANDPRA
ncbi:MAG: hypothetical protein ACREMO_04280 [Gemmatimonadales bacterium]